MKPEAPTGLVSCCNSCFFRMLHVYLSVLSFFPLSFSIHIPRIESFSCLTSFRSSPFRALPFARKWLFAGGRSCFVSKFFQLYVSFLLRWQVVFRVGSGIRSCALPKECRPFFPKTTVSWLSFRFWAFSFGFGVRA